MSRHTSQTLMISVAILAFISAVTTAGNTTKVVVRKLLATPGSTAGAALPLATLAKWDVTMVDDEPTYSVIQLDSALVDGLRADLGTSVANFEPRPDFDVLAFSSYPIDVTASTPTYPAAYTRTKALPSPLRDQFLIQFASLPRPEWFAAFKAGGCTPIDYVPANGYTLLCDSVPLRSIAATLPTQYIELQQPIHKISEALRSKTTDFVDTAVVVMNVPEAQDVLPVLNEATYADLQPPDAGGDRTVFRVTLLAAALPQLAAFPAVAWIEEWHEPQPSGERAVHLAAGGQFVTNVGGVLAPVAGDYRAYLTQQGLYPAYTTMTVAMLDTGWNNVWGNSVLDDLRDSNGNDLMTSLNYTQHDQSGLNNDCFGHGTMVAGAMAGNAGAPYSTIVRDGDGNGGTSAFYMGLGTAPGVHVISGRIWNYLSSSPAPFFDPEAFTTIYADLVGRGVRLVNNSWNNPDNSYTTYSQLFDKLARHATGNDTGQPMTIYVSAGNTEEGPVGNSYVTDPGVAKNVIAVGASENNNPNTYATTYSCTNGTCSDNGNQVWSGSRIGLTRYDGRIKPDLLAPGTAFEAPATANTLACKVQVISAVIDPASGATQRHFWSRGTSFAAPTALGIGVLYQQWFKNKTAANPSPAMLKAMQITEAYDMPSVTHRPERHQGWGKVDVAAAFKTDGRYWWRDQSTPLTTGQYYTTATLTVKDVSRPVTVTVVWTDAPGSTGTGLAAVNDVDLNVFSATSNYYAGGNDFNSSTGLSNLYWWGYPVFPAYDRKNNVEQVRFMTGDFGNTFYVQIYAYSVPGDALHVWNPSSPQQDFAIFIDNVVGQ
jgi:Subtilase family